MRVYSFSNLKFTLKHLKRSYMFRSYDHPHGAYNDKDTYMYSLFNARLFYAFFFYSFFLPLLDSLYHVLICTLSFSV